MVSAAYRNRLAQKPYEEKIFELRDRIEVEAKKLQNVSEANENARRENAALVEHGLKLQKDNEKVEEDIAIAHKRLEHEIELRTLFISNSKKELKILEKKIKDIDQELNRVIGELDAKKSVLKEINLFIEKEQNARLRWLSEQENLDRGLAEIEKLRNEYIQIQANMTSEKQDLDSTKEYLKEFYGKVATYVSIAKETIEFVNAELAKSRVPLQFGLPTDKVTKIEFK